MVAKYRQVGHHTIRSSARRQAGRFARPWTIQIARSGHEVNFLQEAASVVTHDGDRSPAERTDIVASAAAGQAHLRVVILADHRAVQVAVRVDLRPADEPVLDETALGGLHHVADACRGDGAVEGAFPANRHGQCLEDGTSAPKLEDCHQVRGVHALGQGSRQHRDARPNESRCIISHQPRCGANQQLGRGISVRYRVAHCPLLAPWL